MPQYQMLVIYPAFYLSSYVLPREGSEYAMIWCNIPEEWKPLVMLKP
jgi:hypothetical protein